MPGFKNHQAIEHAGVIYKSIRQAAIAAGVTYTKFRNMKGL